jgi:hypothetical protein
MLRQSHAGKLLFKSVLSLNRVIRSITRPREYARNRGPENDSEAILSVMCQSCVIIKLASSHALCGVATSDAVVQ